MGYINVNPFASEDDFIDFDRLDAMEAVYESEFVRQVRFPESLSVCVDGRESRAAVLDETK